MANRNTFNGPLGLNTTIKQAQQKSVKLIEEKKADKTVPYRLNEEVTYYAKGEEPRVGNISNMTEWRGDKIFEITFEGGGRPRWGSDRQIKRTKAAWEIIKKELEELEKMEKGAKKK